jgi:hypothetical protein
MDPAFYTDLGDKVFNGNITTVTLNGSAGATPIQDVPFEFMTFLDAFEVISWSDIPATPSGTDDHVVFENLPSDLIGTTPGVYHAPVSISRNNGAEYVSAGEASLDVEQRRLTFAIGEVRPADGTEYLTYRTMRVDTAYTIKAGAMVIRKH